VLERLRGRDDATRVWLVGSVLFGLVAVPLVVSGPGNDLDVGGVFRSGRSIARHLSYVPSRAPGAPVHEAIVGVLDLLGGPLLTNLASVAAAVVLLVALDRLLRREGIGAGGRWAVALVAANPWFVIAATSTADYVFALAFVVLAAHALRSDRAVLAGVLAGAAMGCRVGSAALIVALFIAELGSSRRTPSTADLDTASHDATTHDETVAGRSAADASDVASTTTATSSPTPTATSTSPLGPRSNLTSNSATAIVALAAVVTVVTTAVLFVPSFLHADGLSFAQNDFSTSSTFVQLGRAAVKDLTLLGPVATLVALAAVPALLGAVRTWRASWLVRFALPGLVLSQILFVRFPWKMAHLLPGLLCLAILLGVALDRKPRLLVALVALQLVFAVVRVDVIQPDDPNEATGGRISLGIGWGPVITDWQCRRDDPDAYRGRQKVEIERAWDCAKPFGG
jgi:hypothetical protein